MNLLQTDKKTAEHRCIFAGIVLPRPLCYNHEAGPARRAARPEAFSANPDFYSGTMKEISRETEKKYAP